MEVDTWDSPAAMLDGWDEIGVGSEGGGGIIPYTDCDTTYKPTTRDTGFGR